MISVTAPQPGYRRLFVVSIVGSVGPLTALQLDVRRRLTCTRRYGSGRPSEEEARGHGQEALLCGAAAAGPAAGTWAACLGLRRGAVPVGATRAVSKGDD